MLVRALLFGLLAVLLIRSFWVLVASIVQGASMPSGGRHRGPATSAGRMVRDPVCGTYVLPSRAVTLTEGSSTVHFCSDACKEAYQRADRS